ncbi:hypothetical protein QC764_503975 [Podospora pseudoanserina]|uniref:Uncharacterized protein n=1 Tax=Podospora pseudoanserina TaxID=2609844 RepID=A0ABR0I5G7_9PEZI|nr:hypothetical protein QC764_503975 [Podospora pseudoanserina]
MGENNTEGNNTQENNTKQNHNTSQSSHVGHSILRLISLTTAIAGRQPGSYDVASKPGITGAWIKTIYRLIAHSDTSAPKFPSILTDDRLRISQLPLTTYPTLPSTIEAQFKPQNRHGRPLFLYLESRLRNMRKTLRNLTNMLSDADDRLRYLSEVISLLQSLHRYARDRLSKPFDPMELDEEELEHLKRQMMVLQAMPEPEARTALAPVMEKTETDLEWEALQESTTCQESQRACDWLQRKVIRPLLRRRKNWNSFANYLEDKGEDLY